MWAVYVAGTNYPHMMFPAKHMMKDGWNTDGSH